jgi:CBS-domain-containing membrane protein
MTPGARFCFDDDAVEDALAGMGEHQIRRMPVLDRRGTLIGILSLSDALPDAPQTLAAEALEEISAPGGEHSQADDEDPHGVVAPTTEAEGVPGVLHFTDDEPS